MNLSKQVKNSPFSRAIFAFLIFSLFADQAAFSYWVWSPESGKFVNPEGAVEDTLFFQIVRQTLAVKPAADQNHPGLTAFCHAV